MLQLATVSRVPSAAPGRTLVLALAVTVAACSTGASRPDVSAPPDAPGPASVRRADGSELPHLAEVKSEIIDFHDSGEWESRIDAIGAEAQERLDQELPGTKRPALVLDIDDTALSTFSIQKRLGFGWVPEAWDDWVQTGVAPAHRGILELYRHAQRSGVAVFFVTGRREHLREATERQLRAAGYTSWVGLYMKPDDYAEPSAVPYKAESRRQIEEQGFEILVNVGDQSSDLDGGHARGTYQVPNPMYYRP